MSGVRSPRAPEVILRPLLTALAPIGDFDEEQAVRRIIVSLPVPVLHHQDLDAAQPAGEYCPPLTLVFAHSPAAFSIGELFELPLITHLLPDPHRGCRAR